jgi:hypothetical protein
VSLLLGGDGESRTIDRETNFPPMFIDQQVPFQKPC